MKKITLLLSAITAFAFSTASATYNVTVTNIAGGGFENAPSANFSPTLGEQANNFVTDSSLFATSFIAGIGNVDVYKSGVGGAWNDSSNAQSFTINIVGTPTAHGSNPGPRWRTIRSVANGNTFNGNWSNLSTGSNTISFGGVAFDRMVGFQIAGVVQIDSFTHSWTTGSDTLSVSAAAVPEVSHYGLLTGAIVLAFAARRRR